MVGSVGSVGSNKLRALLTVRQVAKLLHIHPNTVRRWNDRGLIKGYSIGRRGDRRFEPQEIDRFLAESSVYGDNGSKTGSTWR